jgi:formylglycine-generating enzyme required for sulfatase activity
LPERRDPVIHVSWNDAKAYCEWLSEKSGQTYRLPTEAEWEYAAGNGAKHTKYSWGNGQPYGKKAGNLADETGAEAFNWNKTADSIFLGYDDGYKSTAPVGSFLPNDFGLYDMTGNVWEWCSDWKGDYSSGIQTNPQGPSMGSGRVFRGGSWGDSPLYCRVAGRDDGAPHGRVSIVGFRIARTK